VIRYSSAPKGQNKSAQGRASRRQPQSAALGTGSIQHGSPERAREPQWLGLSIPKKKRRGEERRRTCSTETYLCESALVQNSLLAPCNFAGVSSQGGVTGGTGEDAVSKGPGRETSGDSSFGRPGTPSTALSQKRWGSYLMILSLPAMRLSATNHGRCCLRPPGENGPRP